MDDANALFQRAEAARKAALKMALRDRMLWADQFVSMLCGGIKGVAVYAALAIALERYGLPREFASPLSGLVVLPIVAINPRSFFWKNVFSARADAAFDNAIRNDYRN